MGAGVVGHRAGFYQRLLSDQLGGKLPAPAELAPDVIGHADDVRSTLEQMHLWIQLLDMAITPAMLRLGVQSDLDPEVAEGLLRYFARHRDDSGANRDKTDLVATFLFRHPARAGQWEQRGYGLDGSIPLSPFEIALLEILSESDVPVLSGTIMCNCCANLALCLTRRIGSRISRALMDSGIIPRVRELKASLGESIYHPGVLATLAPYNAAFGDRFHALFAAAAEEIKDFAQRLEELGGSILSTVDGVEVTVEHVAALNQEALLKVDYGAALEKFRRVSRLKKELERRPPIRRAHPDSAPSARTVGARRRSGRSGTARCIEVCSRRHHSAGALDRRSEVAAGGRIDSRLRARGRSQVPPDRAHALFQPDAQSGRG